MTVAALSAEAFEGRYRGGKDPWGFAKDSYELGRYRTILESLQRPAYETVYEPGCSVGVLTRQLALIGTRVIGADFAPSAVEQARRRCSDCTNTQIICADVGTFIPAEPLDLIVFSEIGYYFPVTDLSRLAAQLRRRLIWGGEFIAVHWLGHSEDHVLHADRVHEVLYESFGVAARTARYPGFRLDSWVMP